MSMPIPASRFFDVLYFRTFRYRRITCVPTAPALIISGLYFNTLQFQRHHSAFLSLSLRFSPILSRFLFSHCPRRFGDAYGRRFGNYAPESSADFSPGLTMRRNVEFSPNLYTRRSLAFTGLLSARTRSSALYLDHSRNSLIKHHTASRRVVA